MSVRNHISKTGLVVAVLVIALLAVSGLPTHGDSPPIREHTALSSTKGQPVYAPGQLIIEFAPTADLGLQSLVLDSFGLHLVEKLDASPFTLAQFESGKDALALAQELLQHPAVASAEPNYYRYAHFDPNDTYFSYQWHFPFIQMQEAWDVTTGAGATVAVVDTGIAYETYGDYQQAPDLTGTTFVAGYDFVNDDEHPNDDESHGTHVTGTIAQTTNNNTGVAGIAFDAQIMPIKVLDETGTGSAWDTAQGIRWAVDHGADVINLSLGSASGSSAEEDAVQYAYDNGVTVVASAGNDGTSSVGYPAAYEVVIAVGAVRYDETLASYSDHGPALDLVAPGGDTGVDQNGDDYADGILQQTFNPSTQDPTDFHYYFFQGTSMAAPHVAGAAALLIAKGVATTPDEVRAALESTAKDLGDPGRDDSYGYGLIQVADALGWDGSSPPEPTPTPTGPTPTFTATTVPTATPTPTPADDLESRVVQLINTERAKQGKPALSSDDRLALAARRHSQDMADNNFFSHTGSDGSNFFERIQDAGYHPITGGETIAGGYTSPEAVVDGWMNSSGHRAILLGDYAEVGVGYVYESSSTYRRYWTADFAIPSGWDPTATPTNTASPTATSTPTLTDTPTSTFTPPTTPTATASPIPVDTLTPTHTPITTPTATATNTATPIATPAKSATPTISPESCADLNGDTVVDDGDLNMAANGWRNGSEADINGDDVVDISDLMLIAAQLGAECIRN